MWVTSALGNANITFLGTDPEGHPDHAWKIVRVLDGMGGGSLFVKSHPKSTNLWVDAPLNPEEAISQSVAVFDIDNFDAGFVGLPIAEWAELGRRPETHRAARIQQGGRRGLVLRLERQGSRNRRSSSSTTRRAR